jgi:hypothetical protein
MPTAFIICGALGREVLDIIAKHGWDAGVFGIPALDHNHPERIAPHVEERIHELQASHERLIVVFGDCGSRGALDALLAKFPDIERIEGPHCYEMYGGQAFHNLMEEEPGTFFLTDFLLRGFEGLFIKEMGLDRFPELHDAAEYLRLPLEIRETGYGLLEERLVRMMEG